MVDSTGVIENFIGVKIGDLNESVIANFNSVLPRTSRSANIFALDRHVQAGEEFEITFDLSDFGQYVLGGQWEINFKGANVIDINPIVSGLSEDMMAMTENSLRCAWTTEEALLATTVMTIKLEALTSGMISEMVDIDHSFFSSEIYSEDLEVYELNLVWKEEAAVASEEIQLHQNKPNPWNEETIIPFELPEDGEVTLRITNAIGEEVTSIVRHFHSGMQQYKIINEGWAPGMYYYTLRFGDTQLTKTMLILNKR
jgi:hypothetical protein